MKLFIERKPALLTWLMKYKIYINGKAFLIDKTGTYPIEIEDAAVLNISVKLRNYYSGETEISNVKANDIIEIRPSYNRNVMLFLFLFTLTTLLFGITLTAMKIVGWVALLVFLGAQMYYFHIRSTEFFKISIRK